jgi:flagellar biosynthetic protein FlhB
MAGITLMVAVFAHGMVTDVARILRVYLERPHDILMAPTDLKATILESIVEIGADVVPILLIFVVLALAGNLIQHKPVLSFEKLKPKLGSISPKKGLKKKFSTQTLMEFGKSVVKLLIIGTAVGLTIIPYMSDLPLMVSVDLEEILEIIRKLSLIMLVVVLVIMTLIAVADFAFQKYTFRKDMRMTKSEVKDEHKQMEGDPMVKRQLAKIRAERSRERIMAAVPNADVVVTNPTHFAVALEYDGETMEAPILTAKGQDHLAFRIRELAKEHDIPIVENPPLARGLYRDVDIDQMIPVDYYKIVAEVISYVLKLKGPKSRRRIREQAKPRGEAARRKAGEI